MISKSINAVPKGNIKGFVVENEIKRVRFFIAKEDRSNVGGTFHQYSHLTP